eukprot:scaffold95926_cov27-Tisochrysis_lutea.AAC.1
MPREARRALSRTLCDASSRHRSRLAKSQLRASRPPPRGLWRICYGARLTQPVYVNMPWHGRRVRG